MEPKGKTPKWLKRLQKESWNLELLISGFSIFLLFQGVGMIEGLMGQVGVHYMGGLLGFSMMMVLIVLNLSTHILIFNLVLHILIRGFWIGTIGLNSVKNKSTFSTLNYTEKFNIHLNERLLPLERLIIRLDNFCSGIFAFTFLILLMLGSLFSVLIVLALIIGAISKVESWFFPDQGASMSIVYLIVFLIFIFTGLLYLLDTITLGSLKKIKWLEKIYYPIYRLFNFITFSYVYSSIYYHLLTRFAKRYLILTIIFYLGIFFVGPFFTYNYYRFYPDNETNSELFTNTYDDERTSTQQITTASIPSLIIEHSFLPLFIRYDIKHNEILLKNCTDYEPSKKSDFTSGIHLSSEGFSMDTPEVEEADPEKLLNCLQQHYRLYLNDSLYQQNDFYFFRQPGIVGEKGIRTVLDIADLPRGKNLLKITQMALDTAEVAVEKNYVTIPFWKE